MHISRRVVQTGGGERAVEASRTHHHQQVFFGHEACAPLSWPESCLPPDSISLFPFQTNKSFEILTRADD
jgi:hypothetical protein